MTAAAFKAARIKLGMSQGAFATAIGYSNFITVNRKENDKQVITAQDELIITCLLNNIPKPKKQSK